MKKIVQFSLLVIATTFSSNGLLAQTHNHSDGVKHDHSADQNQLNNIVTDEDINSLTGFDETTAIAELKAKGIPEFELAGALKVKKTQYILAKRGISTKPVYTAPTRSKSVGPCDNAGFDYIAFTNWTGATGTVNTVGVSTWTGGITSSGNNAATTNPSARHTLLTNAAGTDPNARNNVTGAYEIPLIAPGGNGVSVRLGNAVTGAESEKLEYPVTVTAANTSFTYQYAVVLESPIGHLSAEQPRFEITVKDNTGTPVTGPCGVYSVEGLAAATDTTFKPYYTGGIGTGTPKGYYKKWTTVGIDLTPYIGTTVTIEFRTMDCVWSGHYGYAYIDASCSQLQATVNFCPNDTILLLSAPGGYNSYQWYDGNNVLIPGPNGTNDTLTINNPVLGQVYSVSMLSASGCGSSLTVTLGYSNINVLTGQTNVTCYGDNDGMAYAVPSGAIPPFTYNWVDASTGLPISANDSLTNAVAGTYYVTTTSSGGCFKTDTIVITEPANTGDSLDITLTFCPGDNEIVLYAPTDTSYYGYIWHAGPNVNGPIVGTDDSLVVFNPVPGYQYFLEIITAPPACHIFLTTFINYQNPPVMPDYQVKTNVFTPNGDGKNDFFDLSNFKHVKDFKVEVYNRWGREVFYSFDMSVHWDGKIDGRAADAGVYFYIARYVQSCDIDAPKVESTGFVHLVR